MLSCKKNQGQHVIVFISVIIIIVSITCGVLIGCKTGQRTNYLEQSVMPSYQSGTPSYQWCLPCDLLTNKSNFQLMEKLETVTVDNVNKCCANNSEQVSTLVEMVTSQTEGDSESLKTFDAGNFSLSKASAHRRLTFTFRPDEDEPVFLEDENMSLEFEINPDNPFGEHARNIEVMKHALIVLQPGMYFIYSSIFFKPDSARPCKDLKKQTWEHNIILTRNNDKEHSGTILNSTYTCCDNCTNHKETSYAGGLFNLKENDRLHVEVSSDGVVSFRKEGSYLGLFMLT